MFIDPHYARENGFQVSGKRYLYIREDMESGAWNQSVIHGRTGLCPISIYRVFILKMVIIENMQREK